MDLPNAFRSREPEDIVKQQPHELTADANQRELSAASREMREAGAPENLITVSRAVLTGGIVAALAEHAYDPRAGGPTLRESEMRWIALEALRLALSE